MVLLKPWRALKKWRAGVLWCEAVGAASTTNTVWIFNPGSNSNQASKLRVVNRGSSTAAVNISGIEDAGEPSPGTNLRFNLSAGSVKEITAAELENGSSAKGLQLASAMVKVSGG